MCIFLCFYVCSSALFQHPPTLALQSLLMCIKLVLRGKKGAFQGVPSPNSQNPRTPNLALLLWLQLLVNPEKSHLSEMGRRPSPAPNLQVRVLEGIALAAGAQLHLGESYVLVPLQKEVTHPLPVITVRETLL